jgi:vitamin-K-epoxide reductase (warfarin-sensitive)
MDMIMIIILLALALGGFAISAYAYITEKKIKNDATFKPACDLSDRISCSRVMLSPYANMLLISNALVGIAYYAGIAILAMLNLVNIIFYAAIASCAVSCFLAYILYFKIKSFCILCTTLYVINILMLIFAYQAMRA